MFMSANRRGRLGAGPCCGWAPPLAIMGSCAGGCLAIALRAALLAAQLAALGRHLRPASGIIRGGSRWGGAQAATADSARETALVFLATAGAHFLFGSVGELCTAAEDAAQRPPRWRRTLDRWCAHLPPAPPHTSTRMT